MNLTVPSCLFEEYLQPPCLILHTILTEMYTRRDVVNAQLQILLFDTLTGFRWVWCIISCSSYGKISVGVSRQGLFWTLHLLSTKMLMDSPKIWFYKCPSITLFLVVWHSECKDTVIDVTMQAKKCSSLVTKFYITWSHKETKSFIKRFFGFCAE